MVITNSKQPLEDALLAAHDTNDAVALVELYTTAADRREAANDIEAACFYLTHAYVFALANGQDAAVALRSRLVGYGRES